MRKSASISILINTLVSASHTGCCIQSVHRRHAPVENSVPIREYKNKPQLMVWRKYRLQIEALVSKLPTLSVPVNCYSFYVKCEKWLLLYHIYMARLSSNMRCTSFLANKTICNISVWWKIWLNKFIILLSNLEVYL